ncbi:MAG: hypothetical protein ACREOU_15100 [Candidatus Eiseniibacteriota bacterium]
MASGSFRFALAFSLAAAAAGFASLAPLRGLPGGVPEASATIHSRIDFETPGYGQAPRRLSDHFLLKQGGVWHLFYTELPSPAYAGCRIGHVTSTDLVHWTDRPDALVAGSPSWMSVGAWAPHILPNPGGGWIMLFTGRSETGCQVIAAATSGNLDTWQLVPENPVYTPPPSTYHWGEQFANSCRDPFIYFESGAYSMLFTVTMADGRPAIGRATSLDLIHWNDAGPFVIDTDVPATGELESPSLVFDNGRVELLYTQIKLKMATAATSAGPFDLMDPMILDPFGAGAEKLRDGGVQLLSRLRFDTCQDPTSIIVIDTVTAIPGGYAIPAAPALPAGWWIEGDAFHDAPTYGDGPALRGDTPAQPQGLRWLASGENRRLPGGLEPCGGLELVGRTGSALSPPFQLQGEELTGRLMGAASDDSAYVSLLDDCTGEELERITGPGTTQLLPFLFSNTGRRGWSVRLKVVDQLTGPDGVIGIDAVFDSSVGSPAPMSAPAINQTAPSTGENLASGSVYTVRWTSFHAAGIDSHVVYVSYDSFATPPIKLQKRNGNQFSWGWTVPPGPIFNARIRVVAYAKNGVHACDPSGGFSIGVTVDVPPADGDSGPALGPGLRLVAFGNPGPRPMLEWEAAAGVRAELRLYDVRGRLVRSLDASADGGVRRVTWDGKDASGRNAPSGLFFAVLQAGDENRSVTLVRLIR